MYILRYQNFKVAIIDNIRRSNQSRTSVRCLHPKCNFICKKGCINFGKKGHFQILKISDFAQISKRQLFLTSFLLLSYFFPNQPVTPITAFSISSTNFPGLTVRSQWVYACFHSFSVDLILKVVPWNVDTAISTNPNSPYPLSIIFLRACPPPPPPKCKSPWCFHSGDIIIHRHLRWSLYLG